MTPKPHFRAPPDIASLNYRGEPRRVGVEIEFAAVGARQAAVVVQSLFGGELRTLDRHLHDVIGTELGDFRCELDFQYAHKTKQSGAQVPDMLAEFEDSLRGMIGDVSAVLAPCEVACPPVEIARLPRLEQLRAALRRTGAEGSEEGLLYAFGAQFNPDIASKEADYLTAMLKAYVLASDWLRAEIRIDPTRRLLAFSEPFPEAYAEIVLDAAYWPETDDLIAHYLAYNPTRNRELDMLPLFAWLDEARVRDAVSDPRIKPRPTFHYRLPNANIQDPDWTLAGEWNRWCRVEHLAADSDRLAAASQGWFENRARFNPGPWRQEMRRWLE